MITAIIQARLGSTRLPGKLLRPIQGKALLEHVVLRVRAAKSIQNIVIAATTNVLDDPIVELAKKLSVTCYRGSEEDVLDRFYQAAKSVKATVIVRITPDDPFKDPEVIDKAVHLLTSSQPPLDYVANASCDGSIVPTYPEGLDTEAFTMDCLTRMWTSASKPSEREHVTPYVFSHRSEFQIKSFANPIDLSSHRWTIDYENDFAFADAIYARLYPSKPLFLMNDILQLLAREPELAGINSGPVRNEGYKRSLQKEATR